MKIILMPILLILCFVFHQKQSSTSELTIFYIISTAPQVKPRNFALTAVSSYCVSMSYDPVLYPNGPESGLVYQVN